MSTSPAAVPTTPSLHTGESYQEKAWRKFREQPLVPIGTLVTCGALIMAAVKMRRGDSQSLNNWLRVRVIAQGATIAAVCAGTYAMSSNVGDETRQTRQIDEIQAHREARAGRERKEFEDRLKDAEKQWKETEDAVSRRDLNTNIVKGVSTPNVLPVVEDQTLQSSSQSGSSWSRYVRWPWNGSSTSSNSSTVGDKKSS
ncbi:hypoxia induced protein conserved region-domain-containing protein [Suillus subalutaceus]|uniref:hypoxia induced protein conserved region-domain-containing protein n=1 Tax=Suillus subalutaceus TaxID=48586 RepID=UPI001B862F0D|nr:hypoxia induced protein conserved region-domain-containing protein [Suillus subalutaceus]KAG1847852.1 hypoxia induced protein conserved region-domain-containing protein [Suillus subalutaceus]